MDEAGAQWHECHLTGTVAHVSVDGSYAGHIVISDEVKPDAAAAIAALKEAGVKKTVMLTGDAREVGEAVAKQLGIDEAYTRLLPADKVEHMERLLARQPKGEALAFVGDGVNDAPVLARADVGIAMGGIGSDAAIEAADVVLMDDKPSKLAEAVRISRRTLRIVHQHIAFALVGCTGRPFLLFFATAPWLLPAQGALKTPAPRTAVSPAWALKGRNKPARWRPAQCGTSRTL